MGTALAPATMVANPRFAGLLSARGWSLYGLAAIVLFVVLPILHLAVPVDSALHLSDFWVTLLG